MRKLSTLVAGLFLIATAILYLNPRVEAEAQDLRPDALAVNIELETQALCAEDLEAEAEPLQLIYPDDEIELVLQPDGTYNAVPFGCFYHETWHGSIELGDCFIKTDLGGGDFFANCTEFGNEEETCNVSWRDVDSGEMRHWATGCGYEERTILFVTPPGQLKGTLSICWTP